MRAIASEGLTSRPESIHWAMWAVVARAKCWATTSRAVAEAEPVSYTHLTLPTKLEV